MWVLSQWEKVKGLGRNSRNEGVVARPGDQEGGDPSKRRRGEGEQGWSKKTVIFKQGNPLVRWKAILGKLVQVKRAKTQNREPEGGGGCSATLDNTVA